MNVPLRPGAVSWRRAWQWPLAPTRAAAGAPAWLPGLLGALLLTVPSWAPFLRPDLNLWKLPDGDGHLFRTFLIQQAIAQGDWYPRWQAQQYGGYGYPALNFYAPGAYYATLLLAALMPGAGLYGAFQALGALAAINVIGATYALGWRLWRHGPAALFAAGVVAYAPYLLPANLFLRGALPEVLGLGLMLWLLVACAALWRRVAGGRPAARWWWFLLATIAGLLVTHNVSAAIAAVVALGWVVCLWLWRPSLRPLAYLAGAGAAAAAFTAFLWLPALLETSLVQVERMHRGNLHYRNWFLTWPGYHSALWGLQERSPFTTGFPIDLHPVYPQAIYGPPKLSLWQGVILLGATAALAAAGLKQVQNAKCKMQKEGGCGVRPAPGSENRSGEPATRRRIEDERRRTEDQGRRADDERRRDDRGRRRLSLLVGAYGVVLALGCYAQSWDWALPWWERLPALRSIQFPFRLLGPAAYGVALAGGSAVALWLRPARPVWALAVVAVAGLAIAGTGGRPVPTLPDVSRRVDLPFAVEHQRAQLALSFGEAGEFVPRTADYDVWHEGEARGFWLYERMFPEASWLGGRLLVWRGSAGVRSLAAGQLWAEAEVVVEGDEPGVVAFHQLAFPGWRAWIDGRPARVEPPPRIEAQAIRPGFALVEVPPGAHRLAIRFGPDGPRLAGAALSLAAALALAAWLLRAARRAGQDEARRLRYAAAGGALLLAALVAGCRLVAPLRPPRPSLPGHQVVVASLVEAAVAGQAAMGSPSGPALGRDRFLDVRYLAVQAQDRPLRDAGPRPRRWLFMHPPAQLALDLALPEDAYFQTSLALDPSVWETPVGDGVRFIATLTPQDGPEAVLIDLAVNPRAHGEHRRWIDVVADLRPWAGRRVRLTLRTDPRQDPAYDWAGWAEPVVVRLDALTGARLLQSTAETLKLVSRP